ncbi:tetratricopeptide repeat protein [Desulfovibrio ferrophilus]|uniref:Tetratricopeptide domain-containing protein n=1 Tax=Desulfovibrio ferrophilus TaxID=241368 RepID=A0A2Z6B1F0_9BACT|nr:tetratricopeptide repeat protein [Desulfovibrio ferrophilus]BBD09342.1 tetratricopeptide domain-containing protein [Desulfovibrio ferrophilus]
MSSHLDYEINKELGECYLFMGDLDKAVEYYDKAVQSNGIHPDPYLGLATIAVQQGELERAYELYKKAAEIEQSDKALAGMALVEMETNRQNEAFDHFSQALDQNPENMISIFMLVQLGHVLGRIEEVIPHMENYLAIDPLKHDVRYSLAGCLSCVGKPDEARGHLERILETDPDNESAKELLEHIRS